MEGTAKVLILSASAGTGHVRAAQALSQAFHEQYPEAQVRNLDALEYTSRAFRDSFSSGYAKLAKDLPSVWRFLYEQFEDKRVTSKSKKLTALLDSLNARPLRREVKQYDPDAIVCTHFLPAEIFAARRRKGKLRAPVHVALTDFDVHAMWVWEGVDRYFVAAPAMAYALKASGIGKAAVTVTGIPILPAFSAEYPDKPTMRRRLGLRPEPRTVLMSSGGFGAVPLDQIAAALADEPGDVQLLAVAGTSAKLREALDRAAASRRGRIVAYGFVDNMHELMAASDLAIAKPGGLTSSECLAMGLPMVIVKPIPGQEERNADFLLEAGAAVRAHSVAELRFKTADLLASPERLEAMRAAAKRAARPRAAYDIAAEVMEPTP